MSAIASSSPGSEGAFRLLSCGSRLASAGACMLASWVEIQVIVWRRGHLAECRRDRLRVEGFRRRCRRCRRHVRHCSGSAGRDGSCSCGLIYTVQACQQLSGIPAAG